MNLVAALKCNGKILIDPSAYAVNQMTNEKCQMINGKSAVFSLNIATARGTDRNVCPTTVLAAPVAC
jgi:hypothetical protein